YDVQAICRGSGPSGYQGTIEQCYCECNRAVQNGFRAKTCSWFPTGQFSTGGCSYCEQRRKRQSKKVENDSSVPTPFLVQKCSCIGCDSFSSAYLGTLEQCQARCQSMENSFVNGQVTSSYLPNGFYSKGSCNCCGYKDPCEAR
ncbi:unnamed protein product, partial [Rotaria sp. Silwood1]